MGVQNHPSIHDLLRINGRFLPILITSPFEVRSPQRRGYVAEERLVGK